MANKEYLLRLRKIFVGIMQRKFLEETPNVGDTIPWVILLYMLYEVAMEHFVMNMIISFLSARVVKQQLITVKFFKHKLTDINLIRSIFL